MTTIRELYEFKILGGEEFIISDFVMDIEYDPPKYCLLVVGTSGLQIQFECNCPIKIGATVQIFSNPTISDNGMLMNMTIPLTSITVYHDSTVTDDGIQIHHHVCGHINVYDNFIFTARTNYLIKITPKINSTEVSILS